MTGEQREGVPELALTLAKAKGRDGPRGGAGQERQLEEAWLKAKSFKALIIDSMNDNTPVV